jgi:hypothetical protein
MEGAKIPELVIFWIFEKRTVADYVGYSGLPMPEFGFAG